MKSLLSPSLYKLSRLFRAPIVLAIMTAVFAVPAAISADANQRQPPTGFMRDVYDAYVNSEITLSDDATIHILSEEALEAAKAALVAGPGDAQQRHLKDYERARHAAAGRFPDLALENARRHRTEAKKLIAEARKRDLNRNDAFMVEQFEKTSKRRVELLEAAQANLKSAAEIAEEARTKLTSPKPPAEGGH